MPKIEDDLEILAYVSMDSLRYAKDRQGNLLREQRKTTWHLAQGPMLGAWSVTLCGMGPPPVLGCWARACRDATFNGRFVIKACSTCKRLSEPACEPECGCGERIVKKQDRTNEAA
jgi:hypothetical protein